MPPIVFALSLLAGLSALVPATNDCAARADSVESSTLRWILGPDDDRDELERWCDAVGPPLFVPRPPRSGLAPDLRDLVVVTWNAHLHEGRLRDLIAALRNGELTGFPVQHFVLLVQELFRRGPQVPPFPEDARSAHAIVAGDNDAPDAAEYGATLGLAMLYVPSMRNGPALSEDRGNAILSTEPLSNAFSVELPLARQRRVAIGASIDVVRDGAPATLRVVDVHLEPLSSPRSLWFFRNPRTRQANALLDVLDASRFELDVAWAGTVVGGDFNTVEAGIDEPAYRKLRAWSESTDEEDKRATHRLGRLDYVFFRLAGRWRGTTMRVRERFGSDHHPLVGRFSS